MPVAVALALVLSLTPREHLAARPGALALPELRLSAGLEDAAAAAGRWSLLATTSEAGPAGAERGWLSVYRIDLPADAAVTALGGLWLLVSYAIFPQVVAIRCPCDPAEVNRLDRSVIGNDSVFADLASTGLVGLALAVPPVLDALQLGLGPVLFEDLVVYVETLALGAGFVALTKLVVQRPLPRVYAGQDPDLAARAGGYRSFYSGHTAMAVTALSAASLTLDLRYDAGAWPWIVTAIVGGAVSAGRVAAGLHFWTDVAVGAAAGVAIGVAVPWVHRRRDDGARLTFLAQPAGFGLAGSF